MKTREEKDSGNLITLCVPQTATKTPSPEHKTQQPLYSRWKDQNLPSYAPIVPINQISKANSAIDQSAFPPSLLQKINSQKQSSNQFIASDMNHAIHPERIRMIGQTSNPQHMQSSMYNPIPQHIDPSYTIRSQHAQVQNENDGTKPAVYGSWAIYYNKDRIPYYYNIHTQKSEWKRPYEVPPPDQWWVTSLTVDKQKVYINVKTKKEQYIRPVELGHEDDQDVVQLHNSKPNINNKRSNKKRKAKNTSPTGTVDTSNFRVEKISYRTKRNKKYDDPEKAKEAFFSLLRDKNVGKETKWVKILPKIVGDDRYDAIKSIQDKKKMVEEFKKKLEDEEKKKLQETKEKARCDFKKMLGQCQQLNSRTDKRDVYRIFSKDDRFTNESIDTSEKDSIIEDYLQKLRRIEKEKDDEMVIITVGVLEPYLKEKKNNKITYKSSFYDLDDALSNTQEWETLTHDQQKRVYNQIINSLSKDNNDIDMIDKDKNSSSRRSVGKRSSYRRRSNRHSSDNDYNRASNYSNNRSRYKKHHGRHSNDLNHQRFHVPNYSSKPKYNQTYNNFNTYNTYNTYNSYSGYNPYDHPHHETMRYSNRDNNSRRHHSRHRHHRSGARSNNHSCTNEEDEFQASLIRAHLLANEDEHNNRSDSKSSKCGKHTSDSKYNCRSRSRNRSYNESESPNEDMKKEIDENLLKEEFETLLRELSYDCELPYFHSKTKWEEIISVKIFKDDRRYKIFCEHQLESLASELFDEWCWKMDEELKTSKLILKKYLKSNSCSISDTDKVMVLMETHQNSQALKDIDKSTLRLLFTEMIAKALYKKRKKEMAKKQMEMKVNIENKESNDNNNTNNNENDDSKIDYIKNDTNETTENNNNFICSNVSLNDVETNEMNKINKMNNENEIDDETEEGERTDSGNDDDFEMNDSGNSSSGCISNRSASDRDRNRNYRKYCSRHGSRSRSRSNRYSNNRNNNDYYRNYSNNNFNPQHYMNRPSMQHFPNHFHPRALPPGMIPINAIHSPFRPFHNSIASFGHPYGNPNSIFDPRNYNEQYNYSRYNDRSRSRNRHKSSKYRNNNRNRSKSRSRSRRRGRRDEYDRRSRRDRKTRREFRDNNKYTKYDNRSKTRSRTISKSRNNNRSKSNKSNESNISNKYIKSNNINDSTKQSNNTSIDIKIKSDKFSIKPNANKKVGKAVIKFNINPTNDNVQMKYKNNNI